jgi:hypothetical protein
MEYDHVDSDDVPILLRTMHQCGCGYGWSCISGSVADMHDLFKPMRSGREAQERPGATITGE